MTILVVDDDPLQKMVVADMIEAKGMKTFSADSAEEAMEVLEKETVDMIISDIYMPVIDGLKFHKMVRGLPDHALTPFLFISAHDDQMTREAVRNPKIEGFLQKGFAAEKLFEWIRFLTTPFEKRGDARPPNVSTTLRQEPRKRDDPRSFRR